MKDWTKYLQEDPKKHESAAMGMITNNESQPPAFEPTTNNNISNQVTQKKPMSNSFDKIMNKSSPSPSGPTPIPYPNTSEKDDADTGGLMDGIIGGIGNSLGSINDVIKTGTESKMNDEETSTLTASASDYIKGVKFGKSMFKMQARFSGLRIMSVCAIGPPGCLQGPHLKNLIRVAPSTASMNGDNAIMRDAVAKGVGDNFDQWKKNVTVPGLPWYPAFASFPSSHAPPMPNIATPLISCMSPKMGAITDPLQLKSAIMGNLPSSMKTKGNEAIVSAIATALAIEFTLWLTSQMVINVMGKGPVPTFAPPMVPAGPVVNGDIISTPGHLAS